MENVERIRVPDEVKKKAIETIYYGEAAIEDSNSVDLAVEVLASYSANQGLSAAEIADILNNDIDAFNSMQTTPEQQYDFLFSATTVKSLLAKNDIPKLSKTQAVEEVYAIGSEEQDPPGNLILFSIEEILSQYPEVGAAKIAKIFNERLAAAGKPQFRFNRGEIIKLMHSYSIQRSSRGELIRSSFANETPEQRDQRLIKQRKKGALVSERMKRAKKIVKEAQERKILDELFEQAPQSAEVIFYRYLASPDQPPKVMEELIPLITPPEQLQLRKKRYTRQDLTELEILGLGFLEKRLLGEEASVTIPLTNRRIRHTPEFIHDFTQRYATLVAENTPSPQIISLLSEEYGVKKIAIWHWRQKYITGSEEE
ncbi:MAG TPA: hypothetical protein VLF89_02005 [Candidatus Saccharimonadales bacterium]|nr:hypothetical protein [Candidatus Saccharimonadales bacterium]